MRLSDYKSNVQDDGKNRQTNSYKETLSEQDIMSKYNQYKDLSSSELSQELFKEVNRQKAEGTFSYSKLENMLDGMRAGLGEENYQNMKRILESLK